MSYPDVLFIASMLAFATCVSLLVLAAHMYVRENMREVLEDLSGRRRQRGVEQTLLVARDGTAATHAPKLDGVRGRESSEHARGFGRVSRARAGIPASAGETTRPATAEDATLVALEGTAREVDATLVGGSPRFAIVRKTVLCGTADAVEGRQA